MRTACQASFGGPLWEGPLFVCWPRKCDVSIPNCLIFRDICEWIPPASANPNFRRTAAMETDCLTAASRIAFVYFLLDTAFAAFPGKVRSVVLFSAVPCQPMN